MTSGKELRALLEQLVGIDSVNPTLVDGGAGEAEIARFVAEWLGGRGLEVELDELAANRANVVARAPGSGGGRSLILNAHMDTVALGGMRDALRPRVEGRRLYGRGAYDMKASLAAIMLVAAGAAQLDLSGDVILTAVADEEAESIGTEAIARRLRADAAIVTEPTELRLALAHKGFVWLEIETHGRAAHGSRYDLGVDAIALMGRVLTGVEDLDRRLRDDGGSHPLLGGASVHASLIEGGQELSTYPERCVLKIERRTLPGETARLVEEQVRALAAGVGATVRCLFAREPLETNPNEPIAQALRKAAVTELGVEPEVVGVPFWTDAALLAGAGIPTVVFGPGGEGAHADVEWVDLDDLNATAGVLLATVGDFCA
jgi:acetylornithine deacetylase/succinyl-diaminopimelate desuccinylase-like protein